MAPSAVRLRLLRLALAGQTDCEVDAQEIERGGTSFTIDTVRHYAGRFPGADLYFLVGADQLAHLPQWREASELAQRVEFVVIPRPGIPLAPLPPPFRGRPLEGFPLSVLSSQIRARVRAGLALERLLPGPVAEAIRGDRLYLENG